MCFAYQKGRCRAGNSCKFSHDTTASGSGGNAADRSNHNRGVCHNFMSGHCNRGDSCRYSHNSAGIAKQKARGASGALDKPWEGLLPGKTIAEAKRRTRSSPARAR